MKLVEVQPFKYEILDEAKKDGVLMTLEGVFQRADALNANKRRYPKTLWTKLMADGELNERISSRSMVGVLNHPSSGVTDVEKISHVITEHKLLPNGEVRGKMDILDTPTGRIAESLFRAKVKLGVSSRGDGSVTNQNGESIVQDDFFLETYDIVLKPSTSGAFPQIVEEASEEERTNHDKLIAEAVEGLVNNTQEVGILLECHKIINVLGSCSRCESVNKLIRDKLSETQKSKKQENHKMKTSPNLSPELTPELASFLKEQVDRGIAEAIKEKDIVIADLNKRIVDLTATNETLNQQLEDTSKSLEESNNKLKTLEENSNLDEELQTRYDASTKLLDEAIVRLKGLGETQRKLTATEQLLAASLDRHKEEAVKAKADVVLKGVAETVAEKIRPFLMECATPEEVEEKYKGLSSLVEEAAKTQVKEPLPTPATPINEDKTNPQTRPVNECSDFVTSRLLKRIAG